MNNLLDTSVISQSIKGASDIRVMRWLDEGAAAESYISVISLLEIRKGIEQMPLGRKRENLERWLTMDLPRTFVHRVLPVDAVIADACGRLLAVTKLSGHTPEVADTLIAATAKVHGLRIATLNRRHFEPLGVELVEF